MRQNRLLLLVVSTVVLAIVVAWLNRDQSGDASSAGQPLVPGLADVVNEIDAVDIVAPGGAVIGLRRDQTRWRVPEKDNYEADFRKLLGLLRGLAEARIVEQKTANPDWYARLGVDDPGTFGATGRRVDFPGRELPSVIIGQTDSTGQRSFVRRAGEAQSWLIDRVLEVPADPVMWLERAIMDIPAEDIAEVVVRHPDGETVRLQRAGVEGHDFVLLDVPEGRKAGPAWRRTALGNGLRALELDDVKRFDGQIPDDAVRALFVTTDGLNFVVDLFRDEQGHWAHFSVSAEPEPIPADEAGGTPVDPNGTSDAVDGDADAPESDPDDAEAASEDPAVADSGPADVPDAVQPTTDPAAERLANAVAADARLSPWLFKIPERRYNDLTVRLESLLEAVTDEDTASPSS